MDSPDGPWITFLKRFDGSTDFNRLFDEYKNGFGDVNGEYWLGKHNYSQRIFTTAFDGFYFIQDGNPSVPGCVSLLRCETRMLDQLNQDSADQIVVQLSDSNIYLLSSGYPLPTTHHPCERQKGNHFNIIMSI